MKKLAMILAVAFTLGLTASTVTASTKDKAKKEKTECCAKGKKCTKEDKKACSAAKATCAEKPAPAPAK